MTFRAPRRLTASTKLSSIDSSSLNAAKAEIDKSVAKTTVKASTFFKVLMIFSSCFFSWTLSIRIITDIQGRRKGFGRFVTQV